MNKRELTCIGCPLGCIITLEMDGDKILSIAGNSCLNGKKYAENEVTAPKRVLTTSVRVNSKSDYMCSVKTNGAIAKDKVIEACNILKGVTLSPPIKIGDVVYKNIVDSGIDVVATRNIES